jgi:hypothetical protein
VTDLLTPLIQQYLPWVAAGDLAALLEAFVDQPIVDDPRLGSVIGRQAFERYLADHARWLGDRQVFVEHIATLQTVTRAVSEDLLHLTTLGPSPQPLALPVAVAADLDGGRLRAVRVYHSLWPLSGKHQVRPPLLPAQPNLQLSDVVGQYHAALTAGDAAAIVNLFEPDGVAREPSGGEYVYRGRSKLQQFYSAALAHGGIRLEHCTVTDDGLRCALEYNAVQWGATPLPPQAGLAVYERGPTKLLSAARIYDDVDPPLAT